MDNVETAIIGSSLETIDRIGPCAAKISVSEIQDVRVTKELQWLKEQKNCCSGWLIQAKPHQKR